MNMSMVLFCFYRQAGAGHCAIQLISGLHCGFICDGERKAKLTALIVFQFFVKDRLPDLRACTHICDASPDWVV